MRELHSQIRIFFAIVFIIAGQLAAETIKGSVYDTSGALVPGARVMLMKDYVKQQETTSGPKGEFALHGVEPGQYQLQIKKPRFGLFQQTIDVALNRDLDFWAVLPAARIFERMTIRAAAGSSGKVAARRRAAPIGGEVEPPRMLVPLKARYPDEATRAAIEGPVVIYARVLVDGTIANPVVIDSPDPVLDEEVLRALPAVRYAPATLNGKPIEADIVLVTEFKVGDKN